MRGQLTGKHTATNGIGGQICTGGIPGGSTDGGGGGPGAGGGASKAADAGATTHMFVGASYTVPGPHSAACPTAGAIIDGPASAASAAGTTNAARRTVAIIAGLLRCSDPIRVSRLVPPHLRSETYSSDVAAFIRRCRAKTPPVGQSVFSPPAGTTVQPRMDEECP